MLQESPQSRRRAAQTRCRRSRRPRGQRTYSSRASPVFFASSAVPVKLHCALARPAWSRRSYRDCNRCTRQRDCLDDRCRPRRAVPSVRRAIRRARRAYHGWPARVSCGKGGSIRRSSHRSRAGDRCHILSCSWKFISWRRMFGVRVTQLCQLHTRSESRLLSVTESGVERM